MPTHAGRWTRWAGLALALVLVAACAAMQGGAREEDAEPEFSAARLGEPRGLDDVLTPAEREAVRRSHVSAAPLDDEPEADGGADAARPEGLGDKAGKAGLSVLTVGVTLGALVAPFFLF